MSDLNSTGTTGSPVAKESEEQSTLFVHLVMQQSNMALMLMGKLPHPESGKAPRDLEAASLFIDTLQMLEAKTKGNLSRQESSMLQQTLMGLRLAYVEAVNEPSASTTGETKAPTAPTGGHQESATSEPATAAEEEEGRKKFTKKY